LTKKETINKNMSLNWFLENDKMVLQVFPVRGADMRPVLKSIPS
jgi:hypothetical protein